MKGIEYINKLEEVYKRSGLEEKWNHLMKIKAGITDENKKLLLEEYPEFPDTLLEILIFIDGTYKRKYGNEEVRYYFFGSDLFNGEYPYYLYSFENIMENKNCGLVFGELDIPAERDEEEVDEKILYDAKERKWIWFADSVNDDSSLYIDLNPSKKGKRGQILRYKHDPDTIKVIADSFEEFLDFLVNGGMKFVGFDEME